MQRCGPLDLVAAPYCRDLAWEVMILATPAQTSMPLPRPRIDPVVQGLRPDLQHVFRAMHHRLRVLGVELVQHPRGLHLMRKMDFCSSRSIDNECVGPHPGAHHSGVAAVPGSHSWPPHHGAVLRWAFQFLPGTVVRSEGKPFQIFTEGSPED